MSDSESESIHGEAVRFAEQDRLHLDDLDSLIQKADAEDAKQAQSDAASQHSSSYESGSEEDSDSEESESEDDEDQQEHSQPASQDAQRTPVALAIPSSPEQQSFVAEPSQVVVAQSGASGLESAPYLEGIQDVFPQRAARTTEGRAKVVQPPRHAQAHVTKTALEKLATLEFDVEDLRTQLRQVQEQLREQNAAMHQFHTEMRRLVGTQLQGALASIQNRPPQLPAQVPTQPAAVPQAAPAPQPQILGRNSGTWTTIGEFPPASPSPSTSLPQQRRRRGLDLSKA